MEERRQQSIATEKRCDNQLTREDATEERGIRQPAIPAMATATTTATVTDGNHWVACGVASGGSGNGILLWRITSIGRI
jgi:hypothetical protein